MREQSKKTKMSLRGLWRFLQRLLTLALVDIFLAPFIAIIFIFGFNISDPFSNEIPPGDGVWHLLQILLCFGAPGILIRSLRHHIHHYDFVISQTECKAKGRCSFGHLQFVDRYVCFLGPYRS